MKKSGEPAQKSLLEKVKELGQKYGVKVTDLSERGVRAIGIIGGTNHGIGMLSRTSLRRLLKTRS